MVALSGRLLPRSLKYQFVGLRQQSQVTPLPKMADLTCYLPLPVQRAAQDAVAAMLPGGERLQVRPERAAPQQSEGGGPAEAGNIPRGGTRKRRWRVGRVRWPAPEREPESLQTLA